MSEDFDEALGGQVGGHVDNDHWECVCGAGGTARNMAHASISLYDHRQVEHVTEPKETEHGHLPPQDA